MMAEPIQAIETRYRGHRFRSRTEARWAVLFDKLGVRYDYETEGYELEDGTRYLPDFYMPAEACYFEIKGAEPTETEIHKAGLLAYGTGRFVNLLIGAPGKHDLWVLRPAKKPDPDLLAWIEMAPGEWLQKRVASDLRERGYAIPPELGCFGSGLVKDHRYRLLGQAANGVKDHHYALDFCDATGHLAIWHALVYEGYGPTFIDQRYRLYRISSRPERVMCYFQAINVPWGQQGARHHEYFDEIRFSPAFYEAIEVAKGARFEFGEVG
jgi:hypothetical protein